MLPYIIGFYSRERNSTSREEQYKWIINDIQTKYKSGVKLSDIVILARKNILLDNIELELITNKIPFVKQLGISLLDKNHVKDFLSFIVIITNPKSSIHWKRIISLHKGFNINIANELLENTNYIIDKLKKASETNIEINQLYLFYNQLIKINSDKEKTNFILSYLEKLWISKNKLFEENRQDILSLLYHLRNSKINDFITDLYLNREIECNIENVVFLSTIHGAKGLEWNHVYIIDVNNNDFPSINNNYFHDELLDMEEERRLFYVACSRAKKFLTITYHIDSKTNISPFIREIDEKYYLGNNVNKSIIELSNIIPRDVTTILKNYGHSKICLLLKSLNNKEKILHDEFIIPVSISKLKSKYIIGNFIDYLIPKIIQNNYSNKLKKFDLNIIHKFDNFPKKIYYEYIDENTHWTNLLENIFFIAKISNDNEIETEINHNFLLSIESFNFYKSMEDGIKKIIDMFKPKNIRIHYNVSFDLLKAEIDLIMDDILVEIKVTSYEICNLTYISQVLTYGYLMLKRGVKINKVCLYNVQTGIINIIDTSTFDFTLFYEKLFLSN